MAACVAVLVGGMALYHVGFGQEPDAQELAGTAGSIVLLTGLWVLNNQRHRRARRELEARVEERTRELNRVNSRLTDAERIAHLGHWERDLVTGAGYWSAENFRIYGLPQGVASPPQERFLACIHPGDRGAVVRMRAAAMLNNVPYEIRYRVVRPDGTIRHVYSEAEVVRDAEGRALRLIGTTLDITVLVEAEERLKEAEREAHLGHWEWQLRNDRFFWSEELYRLLGASPSMVRPGWEAFLERIHPDDRQAVAALPFALQHSAESGSAEARIVRPDGSVRWVQLALRGYFDAAGVVTGLLGTALDVTARKQGEISLRKLTRAIEQAPLSVVITDTNGFIEYVNPHFTRASGYPAHEAIGRSSSILKSGYTSREDYEQMWRTISAGEVWHGEFHNKRQDGRLIWERASIAPVRDEKGAVTPLCCGQGGHHRAQARRGRAFGRQRARRGRQHRQIPVHVDGQPRASHAAERDHRLFRGAARRDVRAAGR